MNAQSPKGSDMFILSPHATADGEAEAPTTKADAGSAADPVVFELLPTDTQDKSIATDTGAAQQRAVTAKFQPTSVLVAIAREGMGHCNGKQPISTVAKSVPLSADASMSQSVKVGVRLKATKMSAMPSKAVRYRLQPESMDGRCRL